MPADTPHRNRIRRVGGASLTVVMAMLLVLFVAMTVLRFTGGELLAVRTGSMAPSMEPGDLLISRKVDPRSVRMSDVITFRVPSADNTLVTHRVTEISDDGDVFSTKGDANDTVDPFTTEADDILGTKWFSVPGAGRAVVFLASGLGTVILLGVPASIYVAQSLSDRRRRARAIGSSPSPAGLPASPALPTSPAAGTRFAVPTSCLPADVAAAIGGPWALVEPLEMSLTPPPYRPGAPMCDAEVHVAG